MKSGEIVPFYEVCPNAGEEMRVISVRNHPRLPDGDYGLIDSFCADPDCDCRVIYIFVISESRPGVLASITFGWEPLEFYRKWMRADKVDDAALRVRHLDFPGHPGKRCVINAASRIDVQFLSFANKKEVHLLCTFH
ncbi:MAG: hypothetical protein K6T80_06205 [Firmicutes bacterium]|nr:hypothetical protein [Bacillota bacterium]